MHTERHNLRPMSPCYLPFLWHGTSWTAWYDTRNDRYVAVCPECHHRVSYPTAEALQRELKAGPNPACQGCRAKKSFQLNPGLTGVFLDFWYRTDTFPQSPSWLEAIPPSQFNLWGREIRAGLQPEKRTGKPVFQS